MDRSAQVPKAPAIEVWSLYALNLHKATYKGWNFNKDREGKRNFIIGRGGYIGLHRYAGLWTGDNASQWEFLKVSVAQVLALGLSGITISGGDVGGFEPQTDQEKWANPELLMRWYCAYSLLPWFRCVYPFQNLGSIRAANFTMPDLLETIIMGNRGKKISR